MLIRFDPYAGEPAAVVERTEREFDLYNVFEVHGATFARYQRALDELEEATEALRAAREAYIECIESITDEWAREKLATVERVGDLRWMGVNGCEYRLYRKDDKLYLSDGGCNYWVTGGANILRTVGIAGAMEPEWMQKLRPTGAQEDK